MKDRIENVNLMEEHDCLDREDSVKERTDVCAEMVRLGTIDYWDRDYHVDRS